MTNKTALPRRWLNRLGLVAPALLLSLGCAKMSDYGVYAEAPVAAMPPAATVDVATGQAYYDESGYDFSDDLAKQEAMSPADGTVFASRHSSTENSDDGPPFRTQPGEPSRTEPTTETGDPTVSKDDQTPDHGRQIIYVAGMQISVYNLESALALVESLPDRFGGWVHMRNQSQVVLRLPADRLKPAMAELATLGVVEARTLQAQDVTAEYVDLDSRIKVLRETQTQLLDLLGKAKTVEEALHVRKALDQVTMELEVALGRMRQLSDLIAYSTLTVTLVERGPQDHIPSSNDPFGWVDNLGVEATEWR
jgi:hypothetical protein